jgi:ribonuclease HI
MLSDYRQIATNLQVWRAFRSRRRLTIASDGGLKDRLSTFGWKIVSKGNSEATDIPLFEGSGPVDGPYDISSSTRSELGGLVAPLLLCASLAAYWGLRHRCKLKWLTDSKAAISRVDFIMRRTHRPARAPEDHDYMVAIKELLKSLGTRIKPKWIKGHQDDRTPYNKLPREAKLNVDVDNLATRHQNGHKNLPKETIPHLSEQKMTVVINGQRYPSQVEAQIRFHINGSNLKHYLQAKRGWSEEVWGKIDIHNFGLHFKRLSMGHKVQHMKFIYELQAVGSRKGHISRTEDGPVTRCPCCRNATETHEHLIHCKENPKRAESIKEFKKEACRSQAGSKFGRIIADAFDQWFHDPDTAPSIEHTRDPTLQYDNFFTNEYVDLVKTALRHQHEIGWMNATRGFLAKSWHHVACSQLQLPAPNGEIIYTHRNDGHQRTYQVVLLFIQWSPPSGKVETTKYTDAIKKQIVFNELL